MTDLTNPIDLVRAAVAALNAGDFAGVAALCDAPSLRAFARSLREQYAPSAPREPMTAEMLMKYSPDVPRDVAEYQAAQVNRYQAEREARIAEELPGIASVAELLAATPERVFAAWLEGRSPHAMVARLVREHRLTPDQLEAARTAMSGFYAVAPIGVVHDGDHVAHVLFRHERSGDGPETVEVPADLPPDEQRLARETWGRTHPQVTTCRKQDDGSWRLLADYAMLGIGNSVMSMQVDEDVNASEES